MTPEFEKAINYSMIWEIGPFWNSTSKAVIDGSLKSKEDCKSCGYVNDPKDAGGETKYGIAQKKNPSVDVRNLTWEQAKVIYYNQYWAAGFCHRVPTKLGIIHFDNCVNLGISRSIKILQESINVTVDGVFGPETLLKIKLLPEAYIINRIFTIKEEFYKTLVKSKPVNARFLSGWMNRIEGMKKLISDLQKPLKT